MKDKNKKLLAREILIFFSLIGILIIGIIGIVAWNSIQGSIAVNYRNKIIKSEIILDSLKTLTEGKIINFPYAVRIIKGFNKLFPNYIKYDDSTFYYEKILDTLYIDSLYEKLRDDYDSTIKRDDFNNKTIESIVQSREFFQIEQEQKKIGEEIVRLTDLHYKHHNSKLKYNEGSEILEMIGLIFFIIAYPLRGGIFLMRWAIKTLRNN